MGRFVKKDEGNLDFSKVSDLMPKHSAIAGMAETTVEENKSDEVIEPVETKVEEKVEVKTDDSGVEVNNNSIEKDINSKEESQKKEKKTKKSEGKRKKNEASKLLRVETIPEENEEENQEENDLKFPSFGELLYKETSGKKILVSAYMDSQIIERLDILNETLPKGVKLSRGRLFSNLLTYFFEKYKNEIDAFSKIKIN